MRGLNLAAAKFGKVRQSLIPKLAEELGEQSLRLVQEGFAHGVSPYGTPWEPNQTGTPPLVRTGRLAASYSVAPYSYGGHGFILSSSAPHAKYNQAQRRNRNGSRAPARLQLPAKRPGRLWGKILRALGKDILIRLTREL